MSEYELLINISALLLEKKATLSCAESCTGGKIASLLTSFSGASRYFKGGVIAYDNGVKEEILHVSKQLIKAYGAVSQQCVEAMAISIKRLMKTTYAISTSGIAGPEGGSEDKPVGTIWIAITTPFSCTSKKFHYTGDRTTNIDLFSKAALSMLHSALLM